MLRKLYRKLREYGHREIGRRGSVLIVHSLLFIGVGQAYITAAIPSSSPALKVLTDVAPLWVWGWIWILSGLTCIVAGLRRSFQPLGFFAGTSVFLLWGYVSFMTWVTGYAHLGWYTGLIWTGFAFILIRISGWHENDGS